MEWSTTNDALAVCDFCGFRYKIRELKFNSYGMRCCPADFDGAYDKKNHPQNFPPKFSADPKPIYQPRPDVNTAVDQDAKDLTQQFEAAPSGVTPLPRTFED